MIHYDVEGPHSVNWRPYKYNNLAFSPKRVFCQQNANGLQLLSPNSLPLHQILDLTTLHNHMSQFLKTNLSVCICTHPIDSLSLSNIVTSIIFTSWIHRGSCFSIISFFFFYHFYGFLTHDKWYLSAFQSCLAYRFAIYLLLGLDIVYYWFMNTELTDNSTITHNWTKLI